jgi:SAM-dependent methyltransferase
VRMRLAEIRSAVGEIARAREQARLHTPSPPEQGPVLEVGPGQAPHPRADVVVDKYVADDFERQGALDLSKPLVVADGQRLPFADRTFAYTLALHVLEHATDPARFAAELSRVASAGFVQVPTRVSELTFGWPYHPWLIDRDGDTLIFRPRDGQRAPVGEIFHRAYAESALLRNWWAANRELLHHSIEWLNELDVRVEGESVAEQTAELDVERTVSALRELDRRGALKPHSAQVTGALRCPWCAAALSLGGGTAECSACERSYPVVGQVPILLVEAAR